MQGGGAWAAAGAAAVGNVAGQVAGNVIGVQDGFNFRSLATAAITGGVGSSGAFNLNNGTGLLEMARSAAISNIAGQGWYYYWATKRL